MSPLAQEAATRVLAGYTYASFERQRHRTTTPDFVVVWEAFVFNHEGANTYDDLLEEFTASRPYQVTAKKLEEALRLGLHGVPAEATP